MRSLLATLFVPVLALGLVACNNGNGNDAMSTEAFCERFVELEDEGATDAPTAEGIALIGELASEAPTAEMRDALATVAELLGDLGDLDEDDPEALGRAFEVIFNPEFMQAADTIDEFLEEECGIETDDDFDFDEDFDSDFDDDFDSGLDDDFDFDDDPLSGSAVRDAIEDELPDVSIVSSGSFTVNNETVISLGADVDEDGALEICELAVTYVDGVTGDDSTAIDVTGPTGGDRIATRDAGGSCELA